MCHMGLTGACNSSSVIGGKPRHFRTTLRNGKARQSLGKDKIQKVGRDRLSISFASRSPLPPPPPRVAPPPAMSCVARATPSIVILPRPCTFHRKASLRPNLRTQSHQTATTDTSTADGLPRLLLHDSLNQAGIDTKLARVRDLCLSTSFRFLAMCLVSFDRRSRNGGVVVGSGCERRVLPADTGPVRDQRGDEHRRQDRRRSC